MLTNTVLRYLFIFLKFLSDQKITINQVNIAIVINSYKNK